MSSERRETQNGQVQYRSCSQWSPMVDRAPTLKDVETKDANPVGLMWKEN